MGLSLATCGVFVHVGRENCRFFGHAFYRNSKRMGKTEPGHQCRVWSDADIWVLSGGRDAGRCPPRARSAAARAVMGFLESGALHHLCPSAPPNWRGYKNFMAIRHRHRPLVRQAHRFIRRRIMAVSRNQIIKNGSRAAHRRPAFSLKRSYWAPPLPARLRLDSC